MPRVNSKSVQITAPDMREITIGIRGTAPFVQHAFPQKVQEQLRAQHEAGSTGRKNRKKEARDFTADYEQSFHRSIEGWAGIPASAFRKALISACRLVGFAMTLAKLSIFVEADGMDAVDGTGLVRLYGEPEPVTHAVRNATGVVDLRCRPMWKEWKALVRVRYDAEQFTEQDIANLMLRVGSQVGIGEGRPDSKESAGMGWGLFELFTPMEEEIREAA